MSELAGSSFAQVGRLFDLSRSEVVVLCTMPWTACACAWLAQEYGFRRQVRRLWRRAEGSLCADFGGVNIASSAHLGVMMSKSDVLKKRGNVSGLFTTIGVPWPPQGAPALVNERQGCRVPGVFVATSICARVFGLILFLSHM